MKILLFVFLFLLISVLASAGEPKITVGDICPQKVWVIPSRVICGEPKVTVGDNLIRIFFRDLYAKKSSYTTRR